jgi:hypothetical protein
MGNFISFAQCCGCKGRPISIFGQPKKNSRKSVHTSQPLVRIHLDRSSTKSITSNNIYPTTPPYFVEGSFIG